MKNSRDKALRQFLVLVALFPFCFLALREVVVAVLSAFSWDDTACAWVDGEFGRSGGDGGSHRWFTDTLSLFPTLWSTWFLLGAVDEMRYTLNMSWLAATDIVGRWVALATITQLLPVLVGVLFYHAIVLVLWKPLAVLLSFALVGSLFYWSWKIPGRRVRKVEAIYQFEKVKEADR